MMFYFKGEERTKGEGMKRMEGDCLIFEDTMLIRTVLASLLLYLCSLTFLSLRSLVPSCSFPRSWPFLTSPCKDCNGTCQVYFFFFFHLFLLVGGWLLYNIIVVFIISQILPELLILTFSAFLHPYLAFWLSLTFTTFSILFSFMILHFLFFLSDSQILSLL